MPPLPQLPNRQPIMASRVSSAYKTAAKAGALPPRPGYALAGQKRELAGPRRGIPAMLVALEGEAEAPAPVQHVHQDIAPDDLTPAQQPEDERILANRRHSQLQTARKVQASLQNTMGALHRRGEQHSPLYQQLTEQFKRLGGIIRQAEKDLPKEE